MQKESKLRRLIREQPLFVLAWVAGIAAIMLLLWVGSRGNDTSGGDTAAPDSAAFTLYQDKIYNPFGVLRADNFIRDDLAYFARKTMNEYDPGKNPGVVFEVKEFTPAKDGKVSFKGKYEKVKGDVTVTAERLAYDRVKVSITWNGNNIDAQLPSASQRNKYIITLPIEESSYQISYSAETDSFTITPTATGNKPIEDAKASLKASLGEAYSESNLSIEYPAYLKGEPQHNTSNTYNSADEDIEDH